ncbi:MAG: hypothetical protein R2697_03370 [Ilumatobacteraceae bacterium]
MMIPLTVSNLFLVAVVTVVLFSMNAYLALFALLPLPFLLVNARSFSTRIHPAVRAVQQEQAQLRRSSRRR